LYFLNKFYKDRVGNIKGKIDLRLHWR